MATNTNTIIGRDTRVRGRLAGRTDLEVQGHLEGELAIEGDVRVDSTGTVAADIHARRIVVRGAVKGNLTGDESIVLEDGARVVGDLRAPRVTIAVGGLVRGYVETGLGGARSSAPHKSAAHHAPAKAHVAHTPAKTHAAPAPAKKEAAKKDAKITLAGGKTAPKPVVPVLKKGTKGALTKRR